MKVLRRSALLGKFINLTLPMILRTQETLKRLIKEQSYREQPLLSIIVNSENLMTLEFHLVLMLFTREESLYLKNLLVMEEPIDHKLHWKVYSKTISVKLLALIFSKGILNWRTSKSKRVQKIKSMLDILMHRLKLTTLLKLKIHLMCLAKLETNLNLKDSKILTQKLITNDEIST